LSVHYAADISLQHYFSKNDLTDLVNKREEFCLLNINNLKNSLLQFIKDDPESQISGITVPWLYYGMLYSTFCWHTEDLYLYSLNYMHSGKPKIWYSIPSDQKEKMDDYIKSKYFALLLKEPHLVHKLTVHINPLELLENGIKVYRTVQRPGEIVVTLPKGYHTGFSTGLNLAEAVNFSVY
jgi:histone demethylase JARID1